MLAQLPGLQTSPSAKLAAFIIEVTLGVAGITLIVTFCVAVSVAVSVAEIVMVCEPV
jgi:hypothetical protein